MDSWSQHHAVIAFLLFLVLATAVTVVAFRFKYFQLPERSVTATVSWKQLAGAFGTYLIITLLFYPLLLMVSQRSAAAFRIYYEGWMQLSYTAVVFVALVLYVFRVCSSEVGDVLFGRVGLAGQLRALGLGVLTWCLAYPWVFVVNLLSDKISKSIWGGVDHEQTAVQHLKNTAQHPTLYFWTMITIIFLVPILEEILFRGFLQSWLRKFLGRVGGLLVTAWIFSSVHYSPRQGLSNISLLCSLFVLSLFLGFLYERQKTLWAPIALHATFNASTVFFLSMTSF